MSDPFYEKLQATFRVEAQEHLSVMTRALMAIEKGPSSPDARKLWDEIYRETHSLKGAARAADHPDVEAVCQKVESVVAAMLKEGLETSPSPVDLLLESVDGMNALLFQPEKEVDVASLLQRLDGCLKERTPSPGGPPAGASVGEAPPAGWAHPGRAEPRRKQAPPHAAETVRIAAAKLDRLLLEAEEMLAIKLSAARWEAQIGELHAQMSSWVRKIRRAQAREVGARQGGLAGGEPGGNGRRWLAEFAALERRVLALHAEAKREARVHGQMVDRLLEDAKEAAMLPLASILDSFPKIARDLAKSQGKQVELVVNGPHVQMDRRLLEQLKDPFLHLLRNAVDHGLETPKERRRRGKPERGRIAVRAQSLGGGKIEVRFEDDGRGLDREKIRAKAREARVVSEEALSAADDDFLDRLIFHPGFSTSDLLTDVSGRGLGLSIVAGAVERLGGLVSVVSRPGEGACFALELPTTLATYRGILVKVGSRRFLLPTAQVEGVARIPAETIRTVQGRETVEMGGRATALVRLADLLGLPAGGDNGGSDPWLRVLVAGRPPRQVVLQVDEIEGEEEVLAKPIGGRLERVRFLGGATVLGSGEVVPILHVPDLLQAATEPRGEGCGAGPASREDGTPQPPAVLVVEDSVTARTLLKNILEAYGYRVRTAVDGAEAWAMLKSEACDLVVSDVDMPRMNGFELTEKIRADDKLKELPVILVTSLESREDKERGLEVGASAYLVKSRFDQENLLETIRRFA